jgi:PKD repeat protein
VVRVIRCGTPAARHACVGFARHFAVAGFHHFEWRAFTTSKRQSVVTSGIVGWPSPLAGGVHVMNRSQSVPRCLLTALISAVLLVCAATGHAATAHAETYGELAHFGEAGVGRGQFRLTSSPSLGTHAFGVDPTDNSVYVGDEPVKKEYRIQKFTASGQYLATTVNFHPPNRDGIEGIAVDPVEKRIYVLALEKRSETATIDSSMPAAGTLYAFSTEPSGEELVPAAGTTAGVLIGPSELEAQSDTPEKALLEPKGIAVDPTTHDVIILGEVDQGTQQTGPEQHVALQRIHSNGTLGARYVDETGYFSESERPNSPIVSPGGSVYVAQTDDELAQIPSNFASTSAPTPFLQFIPKGLQEPDPVAEFDAGEVANEGGGLSFAPTGPKGEAGGTIYAEGHIFNASGGDTFYPGLLTFAGANGAEVGWTGGQVKKTGAEDCSIGFGGITYPTVAAGKERTVFVLDPKSSHVLEFGPEGTGCPAAEASAPSAAVGGAPLAPSETVSPGTPVTFSSTLTQGNALSVEWNFGDGETSTDSTDEYQHVEATHAFVKGGELTVTETIHTDDLATPTIVKETKISVSVLAAPPTALLEGPLEVALGESAPSGRLVYSAGGGLELEAPPKVGAAEATFDASASFDTDATGSNQIKFYHWVFGDGSSETTEVPIVKHRYEKVGVYKVELTVTDALGLTSEPSTLNVKVNPAPPKVEEKHVALPVTLSVPPVEHPAPAPAAPIPDARLAGTALVASASGMVHLVVTCPAGETGCTGTVTLRTLGAVSIQAAGSRVHAKKRRSAVVTLASGAFKVGGGQQGSVALRLSSLARSLLAQARTHSILIRATLVAHDSAGTTHTTQMALSLQAAKRRVKKLITPGR